MLRYFTGEDLEQAMKTPRHIAYAQIIIFGTMRGGEWDWGAMRWREKG